jgi:hypothetical protein
MDLFGVTAILYSISSIFSAVLFVGRPLSFMRMFPKTCLRMCRLSGQVIGKCFESPETFVEIPQKLKVSNRTILRCQVFLHF